MLKSIFSLLETIAGFFDTIWQFITDFFKDTFEMIKLVGETVKQLPTYIQWLPPEVVTSLVVLFGVVVIYKILGREG